MTVDRFIELVDEARQPRPADWNRTAQQDAYWFVSYRIAREIFESYSTKDLARDINSDDGLSYKMSETEDLEGWLANEREANDEWTDETEEAYYKARLKEWFR